MYEVKFDKSDKILAVIYWVIMLGTVVTVWLMKDETSWQSGVAWLVYSVFIFMVALVIKYFRDKKGSQ